jgi:hypothetical protein
MILFRPLKIEDIPVILPYFERSESRLCEHSAALIMWRNYYVTDIAVDGALFVKQRSSDAPAFYSVVGGDFLAGMEKLIAYCRASRQKALFSPVTEHELGVIKSRYRIKSACLVRDRFDYLYDVRDMIELRGRRFHGQRSHISRFDREYPNSIYAPLTDLPGAKGFLERYYKKRPPDDDTSRYERTLTYEVLERWEDYGQLGGVLIANGEVISLSVGEVIGDTLFVHIEKADVSFPGAYQKTVNSFARLYGGGVRYVNREDDMGIEGLRKSKLSYHPAALLEKYIVEIGQ